MIPASRFNHFVFFLEKHFAIFYTSLNFSSMREKEEIKENCRIIVIMLILMFLKKQNKFG